MTNKNIFTVISDIDTFGKKMYKRIFSDNLTIGFNNWWLRSENNIKVGRAGGQIIDVEPFGRFILIPFDVSKISMLLKDQIPRVPNLKFYNAAIDYDSSQPKNKKYILELRYFNKDELCALILSYRLSQEELSFLVTNLLSRTLDVKI